MQRRIQVDDDHRHAAGAQAVTTDRALVEQTAREYREFIRKRCGLNSDWANAPVELKEWYRRMAERIIGARPPNHQMGDES